MKDISEKYVTLRTARARAVVHVSGEIIARIRADDVPKKAPLCVARWAGIQAAKNTAALIPACHPVPLDYVSVEFAPEEKTGTITITAEVKAEYKTGVEMEALTAVTVAGLTLYDMIKPLTSEIRLSDIKVEEKTGGISESAASDTARRRARVIVVSDSVAEGRRVDRSGGVTHDFLEKCGFTTSPPVYVADEKDTIRRAVEDAEEQAELIVLTGGTGPGTRDVTSLVVRDMCEKMLPGIGEWSRTYGRTRTITATLSDSCAGVYRHSLIIALPGSPAGVRESLQALHRVLHHACDMIAGEGHE